MEESANHSSVDQEQRSESKSPDWITFDASTAVGKNALMTTAVGKNTLVTGGKSALMTGGKSALVTGDSSSGAVGQSESNGSESSVVATIEPSHSIQMSRSADHPLTTPSSSDLHIFGTDVRIDTIRPVSPSQTKSSDGASSQSRDVSRSQSVPDDRFQTIPSSSRPTSLAFNSGSKNRRFKNGDIVVSLVPLNSSCAWVTPASFKATLVPEELMDPSLSLTVEEYVQVMKTLMNDFRFRLYTILYKRVIFFWISLGFLLLLTLLFSGATGLTLISGGLLWLIMNSLGIFICIWIKFKLYRQLENCISDINESILMKHNLLLGVDDRGHLSCHKINLYFIYFNLSDCTHFLNDLLINPETSNPETSNPETSNTETSNPETSNGVSRRNGHIDITSIEIEDGDVIITGPSSLFRPSSDSSGGELRVSESVRTAHQSTVVQTGASTVETLNPAHSQSTAHARTLPLSASKRIQRLIGRYSQRWVKEFVRKRLDLNLPLHYEVTPSGRTLDPRHCASSRCLCQFIEEHLRFKPLTKFGWKDLCL